MIGLVEANRTAPPARASPLVGSVREVSRHPGGLVGAFTADPAEPVFAGHYPDFPIFPGVCLIECAHQTALLALPGHAGHPRPRLTAVDRARFLAPVFPGDEVTIHLDISPCGDGWTCRARVFTRRTSRPEQPEVAALIELRYGVPFQPAPPVPAPISAVPTGRHLESAEIKRRLLQRYPILLIDRIETIEPDGTLIGTKAVTVNEPCYAGLPAEGADHSYPAALLVESWCQAAGILTMREHPEALTSRIVLFGAIANLALTAPVGPGDVLRHHARAVKILSDAAVVEGETLVGGVPVMTVGQVIIVLRQASEVAPLPVPP